MSTEERPGPLRILDSYFAAARIAHEYVSDLHRELVELDLANEHTRELMHESAAVTLERMPALADRMHGLEREWDEQETAGSCGSPADRRAYGT
jgi:predicted metal-dependent hydrolase